MGRGTDREVELPVRTEAIMEGVGHEFKAEILKAAAHVLRTRLDAEHRAWQSGASKRWAKVEIAESRVSAFAEPQAEVTVYCPNRSIHYQVQVLSQEEVVRTTASDGMRETCYKLIREERGVVDSTWWTVTFTGDNSSENQRVALSLNPHMLWAQHRNMKAGKQHGFSLLVRDLLRNARCLLAAFPAEQAEAGEAVACFYPSLLEPGDQVKAFYGQKALSVKQAPRAAQQPSLSEKVRRYNNLIKVFEIEKFVDDTY